MKKGGEGWIQVGSSKRRAAENAPRSSLDLLEVFAVAGTGAVDAEPQQLTHACIITTIISTSSSLVVVSIFVCGMHATRDVYFSGIADVSIGGMPGEDFGEFIRGKKGGVVPEFGVHGPHQVFDGVAPDYVTQPVLTSVAQPASMNSRVPEPCRGGPAIESRS